MRKSILHSNNNIRNKKYQDRKFWQDSHLSLLDLHILTNVKKVIPNDQNISLCTLKKYIEFIGETG